MRATSNHLWAIAGRVPLVAGGAAALYRQVQLIWESGSTTMGWAAPLACIIVALVPGYLTAACRERRFGAVLGFMLVIVAGIAVSLTGALGRVAQVRADHTSSATAISRQYTEAKRTADDADGAVALASAAVDKTCNATTTVSTTSKKVRTETTKIDPRCEPARAELERRQDRATAARTALNNVPPVPEVDADTKRLAAMLSLPPQTVEEWQPAFLPLFLEITMMVVFGFAFRPLSYIMVEPEPLLELSGNIVPFDQQECLIVKQEMVTVLVRQWINEEGLPVDLPIAAACRQFNVWVAKNKQLVNVKLFGNALTDLGVRKRIKSGRTLIAAADYKPRRRPR